VVGYAAASGRIDTAALLLFIFLACWQMTHFFAIGIYRRDDYAAANLPIFPVRYPLPITQAVMLAYAVLAVSSLATLEVLRPFTLPSTVLLAVFSAGWLAVCAAGYFHTE